MHTIQNLMRMSAMMSPHLISSRLALVLTTAASIAVSPVLPDTIGAQSAAPRRGNDPAAEALVARSLARMGGDSLLRSITSLRMDVMTQWQRIGFADHPYADAPSYERHTDLRDYTTNSWRNTRFFLPSPAASVDIVRDTIGARWFVPPGGAATITPLNIAYVDERRELFAFAPERTLQLARASGAMRLLSDTVIDGAAHVRISATVDGFPAVWFVRRSTALLGMVRFIADETNDFGLAPWARQEIEFWYSGWTRYNPGVLLPRQRDVRRVGRPYKRMRALALNINAAAPADSFAIPDSTATRYLSTEQRPMWNAPLDSVQFIEQSFVTFPPFVGNAGVVRIGGQWVLLETAQAEGAVNLLDTWLTKQTGAGVSAAIIARPTSGNGGVRWFTARRKPTYVTPGVRPAMRRMIGADAATHLQVVARPQWVRVGSDSLLLTPFELPDFGTALAVYSPTLRWLYTPFAGLPAYQTEHDTLLADLRARKLPVEWLGTVRSLRAPAPRASN